MQIWLFCGAGGVSTALLIHQSVSVWLLTGEWTRKVQLGEGQNNTADEKKESDLQLKVLELFISHVTNIFESSLYGVHLNLQYS